MNAIISVTFLIFWVTACFGAEDSESCTWLGLRCSRDCKRIEYCAEMDVDPLPLRTCGESSFCSLKKGTPQCDSKSCPLAKPQCSISGLLPSADSCSDYTICYGTTADSPQPKRASCGAGQVFDEVTQSCSSNLKCRKSARCRRAGDNGFIDQNTKRFCYYCKEKNTPFVYPCDAAGFQDAPTSIET